MLEYKAAPYGRAFHRIGRFEPTSQICSACGVKAGPKPLHTQVWTCRACGTGTSTRPTTSPRPPDCPYQPAERG
ncbi:zinc ribbon domain-containing protein [Streptomyces zhihengii]|uniref:zinc ribbon domain-containing protein n=1 Tax=Streptomyces zhihengii TaxID=1818004 RepID=UPI00362B12BA